MQIHLVFAAKDLNQQIKVKLVKLMKIALQMMALLLLSVNVDGIRTRLNIVISCLVMMNGLMLEQNSMIISKPQEKTVTQMQDGNNALKDLYIINGCALN